MFCQITRLNRVSAPHGCVARDMPVLSIIIAEIKEEVLKNLNTGLHNIEMSKFKLYLFFFSVEACYHFILLTEREREKTTNKQTNKRNFHFFAPTSACLFK